MKHKAYAYELQEFDKVGNRIRHTKAASNSARYIQAQRPKSPPPEGVQRFETINDTEASRFLFINNLY